MHTRPRDVALGEFSYLFDEERRWKCLLEHESTVGRQGTGLSSAAPGRDFRQKLKSLARNSAVWGKKALARADHMFATDSVELGTITMNLRLASFVIAIHECTLDKRFDFANTEHWLAFFLEVIIRHTSQLPECIRDALLSHPRRRNVSQVDSHRQQPAFQPDNDSPYEWCHLALHWLSLVETTIEHLDPTLSKEVAEHAARLVKRLRLETSSGGADERISAVLGSEVTTNDEVEGRTEAEDFGPTSVVSRVSSVIYAKHANDAVLHEAMKHCVFRKSKPSIQGMIDYTSSARQVKSWTREQRQMLAMILNHWKNELGLEFHHGDVNCRLKASTGGKQFELIPLGESKPLPGSGAELPSFVILKRED